MINDLFDLNISQDELKLCDIRTLSWLNNANQVLIIYNNNNSTIRSLSDPIIKSIIIIIEKNRRLNKLKNIIYE